MGIVEGNLDDQDLDCVIDEIQSLIEGVSFDELRRLFPDLEIDLSLRVCYDSYTCTVAVAARHAAYFGNRNIDIVAACYPTCFEEGEEKANGDLSKTPLQSNEISPSTEEWKNLP